MPLPENTQHLDRPDAPPGAPDEARPLLPAPAARRGWHDLRTLIERYVRRYLPPAPSKMPPPGEPPRPSGTYARILPVLEAIPWLLGGLFAFSFAWDFPGQTLSLFGLTLPLEGLLRIVSVSGLIGFLTNWLAITMLFKPRERRPLLGQGLVPAQRDRIAFRLAQAVANDLLNEEVIKQKIHESRMIPRYREAAFGLVRNVLEDAAFREELKGLTAGYIEQLLGNEEVHDRLVAFTSRKIDEYAGDGLGGLVLRAYRLLNEDDIERRIERAVRELPSSLDAMMDGLDELLDRLPERLEARSEEIESAATTVVLRFVENLDVYAMVLAKLQEYDERQLEELLHRTTNEQLNYIKYLGSVLGCLGGLVIWQPGFALALFAVIGGSVYGLDVALLRRQQRDGGSTR